MAILRDPICAEGGYFGQFWACPNFGKNYRFWPKNRHFSSDFAEILGIDKKKLNTSYVNFLGHLGHFLAKYDNFWHFWLILTILTIFGLLAYIPLTLSAITPEPLVHFENFWHFGNRIPLAMCQN